MYKALLFTTCSLLGRKLGAESVEQIASTLRTHLTGAARHRSCVLLFAMSLRTRRTHATHGWAEALAKRTGSVLFDDVPLDRRQWLASAPFCSWQHGTRTASESRRRPLLCYLLINTRRSRRGQPTYLMRTGGNALHIN